MTRGWVNMAQALLHAPRTAGIVRNHAALWLCLTGLFFSVLLSAQVASRPSPEGVGKVIYSKGESPSGNPLSAVLGDTVVPATLMPCGSCHGADGKGRTEGGITPSDITWSALTRALETDQAMKHRRQAYDLNSLRKVLREGVDPAGNELGITMPRYQISDSDMESLIGYLKQLGVKNDPGVTATSVRAATVVPGKGPLAESGASVAELLRAYFSELNLQGGVYGRMVELDVIETPGTPAETAEAVQEYVRGHEVFALIGLLVPGAERPLSEALENSGIPAIDTFAPDSEGGLLAKPRVFHVLSGLAAQSRALVKFAEDRANQDHPNTASPFVVVYPENKQPLAAAVMEECSTRRRPARSLNYSTFNADEIVATLAPNKAGGIIFLGQGAELEALLAAAARIQWRPEIFQPGPLAGEEAFRLSTEDSERVFFSFSTLPSDVVPEALAEYSFLVRKYKFRPLHTARALTALAAAKVFVEGLRQSGHDLSREGFVDTLASLYNYNTGLTPPITYGATRRVGALGAYVVKLDTKTKTFAPAAPWIEASR